MPKYSVIVVITKDCVVNAANELQAKLLVQAHANEFLESADTPEVSDPAEVDDDYESVTDDQID